MTNETSDNKTLVLVKSKRSSNTGCCLPFFKKQPSPITRRTEIKANQVSIMPTLQPRSLKSLKHQEDITDLRLDTKINPI